MQVISLHFRRNNSQRLYRQVVWPLKFLDTSVHLEVMFYGPGGYFGRRSGKTQRLYLCSI